MEAAPGGGPGRAATALGAWPRRPSRRRRRGDEPKLSGDPIAFFCFI
jgi:hypothetical protein